MQTVQTVPILKTVHFWVSFATGVVGMLMVFHTAYPSEGWIVTALAIAHVILPLFSAPVSLGGGTTSVRSS